MSILPMVVSEPDMGRGGARGSAKSVRHAALGPLSWYAAWVRGNQSNAHQLENLTRTVTMVLSDPSNLINMEGYWSLSKLYTFANQTIINTTNQKVGLSEAAAVFLHVVQEVECLVELAVRKYHGHYAAWNTMLLMQLVKCIANFGVNRHFFLTRWVWAAVRLMARRVMFYLMHGARRRYRRSNITDSAVRKNTYYTNPFSYFSASASASAGARRSSSSSSSGSTHPVSHYSSRSSTYHHYSSTEGGGDGNHRYGSGSSLSRGSLSKANSSFHDGVAREGAGLVNGHHGTDSRDASRSSPHGEAAATRRPRELQLVIPRVVTRKRDVHRHYAPPLDAEGAMMTPMEVSLARSEAETVQLTWIDVLGMAVDGYMLLRPLLVVASARWAFLRDHGVHSSIGVIPSMTGASVASAAAAAAASSQRLLARSGEGSASDGAGESIHGKDDVLAATSKEEIINNNNNNHSNSNTNNIPADVEDRLFLLRTAVEATSQRSLHSRWRLWLLFTALDVLVALLARFIRQRRVPVVYIRDDAEDSARRPSLLTAAMRGGASALVSPRGSTRANSALPPRSARDGEVDGGSRVSEGGGVIVHSGETAELSTDVAAEEGSGGAGAEGGGVTTPPMSPTVKADVTPAMISRDAARQQHAMRNLLYSLLRDPFFSVVLKQSISRYLVHGWVNKIPLLGGLVGFQVAYFLSMQHFSFLYSVGQ